MARERVETKKKKRLNENFITMLVFGFLKFVRVKSKNPLIGQYATALGRIASELVHNCLRFRVAKSNQRGPRGRIINNTYARKTDRKQRKYFSKTS